MHDDANTNGDQLTSCPKCGYESANSEVCDACGAIFSHVRVRQARREIMEETLGYSAELQRAGTAPSSLLPGILGTVAVFIAVFLIVYRVLGPGSTSEGPANLPNDLLASGGEKAVLVEFWAPWCGPCKLFAPVIEKLERDYRGRLKVVRINVDEDQATASHFNVTAIPTVLICDINGRVIHRTVGVQTRQNLAGMIDRTIRD